MKKVIFSCLFLCLLMTLKAQYGAELTVGARVNYIGGGRIRTSDGEVVNLGYTLKGVVSPGYFVYNNIAVGVNLGYEYMMDDLGHQYTLEAVPFIRCYTPHGTLRLFGQLESGYGWGRSFMKNGHDGQHSLWVSTLKPGLFIRIKEYMAAEITLMSLEYKKVYMTDKTGNGPAIAQRWKYNWLDMSFGVSFIIGL